MRRNIGQLAEREYDLIIVGGGIFGICAAWDAALRGLVVGLVERGDFGQATSANCFKVVHGGMRYLQHGDLYRIRESSRERNILLRTAPHLVHPLPIVVPTYGHGVQGKEILLAGLLAYDLLTCDRNRGITDPQKRIPAGQVLSRQECLRLFPGLDRKGLTGAVIFHDGQMYSPARLALSYVKSAVQAGADAANYCAATDFLRHGERVYGIKAQDRLTGDIVEMRAKVVLNAAGPWAERLLARQLDLRLHPELSYSRDAYFIVGRRIAAPYALAVQGKTKDPDAVLSRGRRHLFLVPWRHYTLVGVWHAVYRGDPDAHTVTAEELQGFLDEVNDAYPPFALTLHDVLLWNAGLVLFGQNAAGATDLSYGKRSRLIDHAKDHGVEGLITLIGVRFTTSRGVAEKAIDLAFTKLGRKPPRASTATTPIHGGRIERFDEFLGQALHHRPATLDAEVMRSLVYNHGSEYRAVLRYIDENHTWAARIGTSQVIGAEVVHAVREEVAQKLADVVFRRTDLGTGEYPGEVALARCADIMASERGWGRGQLAQELEEVRAAFPAHIRGVNDGALSKMDQAPSKQSHLV